MQLALPTLRGEPSMAGGVGMKSKKAQCSVNPTLTRRCSLHPWVTEFWLWKCVQVMGRAGHRISGMPVPIGKVRHLQAGLQGL